jgi:uncharacterized membrane protein YgcG
MKRLSAFVAMTVLFSSMQMTHATDDANPLEAVVQQLTQRVQTLEAKVNSQVADIRK